jgi:hypothetical protein
MEPLFSAVVATQVWVHLSLRPFESWMGFGALGGGCDFSKDAPLLTIGAG